MIYLSLKIGTVLNKILTQSRDNIEGMLLYDSQTHSKLIIKAVERKNEDRLGSN